MSSTETIVPRGRWVVINHNWQDTSIYEDGIDHAICTLSVSEEDTSDEAQEQRDAHAELIVQAVNTYPALVAANTTMYATLKDIRDFLKRSGYDTRLVDLALGQGERGR